MGELLELGAQIPPLAVALAFLVPLAIAVYWYGNRQVGDPSARRRGRGRWGENDDALDEAFRAQIRRFQDRDNPGTIALAPAGMVMLRGVLSGADQNLGGAEGRECVWRNRADAPRAAAVAAEIVFFRDASGIAVIEGLEHAQVISPSEPGARSIEWVGLYLGDEIEVIGRFEPESEPAKGEAQDPQARIYGSLGQDGKLHVRLCRRPVVAAPATATATKTEPEAAFSPDDSPRSSRTPDAANDSVAAATNPQ
ncbi:MAG TPA: hypothetical protein ENJ18_06510 [Nannocystis exedens]|nr:hypothetical protein [Nannocystis exedens]